MGSGDARRSLRAAGAAAVRWNCPLGGERADVLVDFIASAAPPRVIDLGCGHGELLGEVVRASTSTRGIGLDLDIETVGSARSNARKSNAGDRLSFVVGDARHWSGAADAALCIGAEEAFGDLDQLYSGVAAIVPSGRAVVGAGFWADEPSEWSHSVFGDMPFGLDELSKLPVLAGWSVVDASASTLDEWDAFEHEWIAGVRHSGMVEADDYATRRATEYERYRGVLGFGWLQLER